MRDEKDTIDAGRCEGAAMFVRGALLLQERWVMIIVHSLLGGSIGFSELMRKGNINTTTLTQRLNLLEHTGILVKTIHSTMPPRTSYELTDAGRALKPILNSIAEWSAQYLTVTVDPQECPKAAAMECDAAED